MAESARPLPAPDEQPTPTPTPVSGVIQTVRPPEVATIEDSTHDLLGAALDELGIEPANSTDAVVVSLDAARVAAIAKAAAEKTQLNPAVTKKSLGEPSFEPNPTPEDPSSLSAAE